MSPTFTTREIETPPKTFIFSSDLVTSSFPARLQYEEADKINACRGPVGSLTIPYFRLNGWRLGAIALSTSDLTVKGHGGRKGHFHYMLLT